ncbi:MAG: hypothetical protein QOF03_788 [Alphaproteobacteria bacterium]|jgi:hypothetical protein|nr:hypothetical protein [Alphaproteobacteria bacterium]
MSGGKFASLTSNLLVRKGEAAPSPIVSGAIASGSARSFVHASERVEAPISIQGHSPGWREGPQRAPAPDWHAPPPRIDAPERVFARPAREIALHSDHPDKPRRLMVALTPEEYEMLGIIGVKKDVTRHQLLRIAFDEYLSQLVEEFGERCHCVANGGGPCETPC